MMESNYKTTYCYPNDGDRKNQQEQQLCDENDYNGSQYFCYNEEYVNRIQERFETKFQPKYGNLWRSMIETQQVKVNNSIAPRKPLCTTMRNNRSNNFLDAIQNKQTISINAKKHTNADDCDCGCLPPILDWEGEDNDDDVHGGDVYVDNKEINHQRRYSGTSYYTTPGSTNSVVNQNESDEDNGSHSSGSTKIHFDISHVVQSSPERSPDSRICSTSVGYPADANATLEDEHTTNSISKDSRSVARYDMLARSPISTGRTLQDNNTLGEKLEDSGSGIGDCSKSSDDSTVLHFDISHIVQSPGQNDSSPPPKRMPNDQLMFEPETNPRLSPIGLQPQSHANQGDYFNQRETLSGSPYSGFSFRQMDVSDADESPKGTPSPYDARTNTSPQADSFEEFERESFPSSNHRDSTDSCSRSPDETDELCQPETRHMDDLQSFNATKAPASTKEPGTLNGSVLIDLVDSEPENEAEVSKQDFSRAAGESQDLSEDFIKRRTARGGTKYRFTIQDSESDVESDSAGGSDSNIRKKQEWNENASSSEYSFHSPDEDSDSVSDLVKRTKKGLVFSDSDNSREDEVELSGRIACMGQVMQQKMTKTTFRRKRGTLTDQYFAEFDQAAFSGRLSSVDVTWSNKLRTTAGQTRLKRSVMNMTPGVPQTRSASIELSTKVLDDPERLRTTLLHEMVHAAAWIIDGVSKPPHGKCFKKWASIAMRHIPGAVVTTTHNYEIEYKYTWRCTVPGCKFVVRRHSKSVDVNKHLCGKCRGKLYLSNENKGGGSIEQTATKKRVQPSAYNMFVKEKSKTIRERMVKEMEQRGVRDPKVSQSDIMKECARLWQIQKTKTTK